MPTSSYARLSVNKITMFGFLPSLLLGRVNNNITKRKKIASLNRAGGPSDTAAAIAMIFMQNVCD